MKRILCLLCLLALAASTLVACGNKPSNGNAHTRSPGDGLNSQSLQFSANWPENEFVKQLPKPDFETAPSEQNEMVYSVVCAATVDQLKDYVESLKKTGFVKNADTIDENAFGMVAYIYTASNVEGYIVEVNYSNMLGSLTTLTITKPS